jgi:hypothetical protein
MQGIDNLTKKFKCSLYHLHNTLGYSLLPLELHFFRVLNPHPLLVPLSVFNTPNIYSPILTSAFADANFHLNAKKEKEKNKIIFL